MCTSLVAIFKNPRLLDGQILRTSNPQAKSEELRHLAIRETFHFKARVRHPLQIAMRSRDSTDKALQAVPSPEKLWDPLVTPKARKSVNPYACESVNLPISQSVHPRSRKPVTA